DGATPASEIAQIAELPQSDETESAIETTPAVEAASTSANDSIPLPAPTVVPIPSVAEITPPTTYSEPAAPVYFAVEREAEIEDDEPTIGVENATLARILGRKPTKFDLEEYYWEPIDEEVEEPIVTATSSSFIRGCVAICGAFAAPVVAVGNITLRLFGYYKAQDSRVTIKASTSAQVRRRRQRQTTVFDTLVPIFAGMLIAVFLVFPLLRKASKEFYDVVFESTVRQIGDKVPAPTNSEVFEAELVKSIAEPFFFPRYEAAGLQQPDEQQLEQESFGF
ncbi:MAG: hypothetical protein HUK22_00220, partial [Thermoguttaceae bacterium]|nr:hypothetical protein [Thermoguttaceae bacterium]